MSRRRPGPSQRIRVTETNDERVRSREDRVVTEEPLEIRLAWPGRAAHRVWLTMRTPGHDFELAAGWATHEGLCGVGAPAITGIAYCTDADLSPEQEYNVVTVTLDAPPASEPHQHDSVIAGSSACGVCGSDSIDQVLDRPRAAAWAGAVPDTDVIRLLPDRLRARQAVFERTGGVHAAGLFTAAGDALVVREDVGRHNAVDKVTGARVLAGDPVAEACLVLSGRIGFELVQKALAVGVGSVVAVGAPSSLALDLARGGGLPVYGFTSPIRTVRYT